MQRLHDRLVRTSACAGCEESSSVPSLAAPTETSGALAVYLILFRFIFSFLNKFKQNYKKFS